jgi:L-asparaginase II
MQSETTSPVLVEVTRGPEVESRHRGQMVVADATGKLHHQLGDPETLVCLRSLAKPFQALAVVTTEASRALGFGPAELALFSGSLSGQNFQTFLLTSILERLGLTSAALQCGTHPPLHKPTAQALAKAGDKPGPLHHTCAGKHAAMLALCVHRGWPIDDYLNPDHPVQQLILGHVARMVGIPPKQIPVAIDGCGAPVFYVPLKNIALGYARLAASQPGSPAGDLMEAIVTHPRHIAGDGRLDTEVMQALPGKIFAKAGSEGGYAFCLIKGAVGVALKIEDGAVRAVNPAVVEILAQLGVMTPASDKALATFRQPAILNHRKEEVGRIRPVFKL